VSGARRAVAVFALLAAYPAAAFIRTTPCKDANPAYRQLPGPGFWWTGAPPTVPWRLHPGHVPPGCKDLATLQSLAVASFDTWTQASSSFSFTFDSTPASTRAIGHDGQNIVIWRKGLCNDTRFVPANEPCHPDSCGAKFNCWEEDTPTAGNPHPDLVLALTWVTFNETTGEILDADIELNDWNEYATSPAGFMYTCAPPGSPNCGGNGDPLASTLECVWADVGSVVTHEAGHVLGLDHPCEGSACLATMSATIPPGRTDKRTLEQDDAAGVAAIYPGSPPNAPAVQERFTGTCNSSAAASIARPSRSCGCGGEPSMALWALLGPVLLWRRRR